MAMRADRVGVRYDQVDVHGRVTSPSFLNELLENLPEWTDMPVWVNGTEEVLPSNTSVPITSPILADIAYPDIRRDNQYFTYRESPTPVDGLAKIKSIKGNTLVWNQLAENGDFADGVGQWQTGGANTLTVTNGVCKIQSTNTSTNNHHLVFPDPSIFQNGHTYLLRCEARAYGNMIGGSIFFAQQTNYINIGSLEGLESLTSAWQSGYLLFSRNDLTLTNGKRIVIGSLTTVTTDDYFELKNICVFDLTQMGLDITSPSEFTSLFSLPYYAYNQGTLLSFMGNGIKTVGKNRFNKDTITLNSRIAENGQIYSSSASDLTDYIDVGAFDSVNFSWDYSSLSSSDSRAYVKFDMGKNVVGFATYSPTSKSVSIDTSSCFYLRITLDKGMNDVQVENGQKTTYEPYTSHTTNLPISTYFPTGMKSAIAVYDELTPLKATTRVKSHVFNAITTFDSTGLLGLLGDLSDAKPVTGDINNTMSIFPTYGLSELRTLNTDGITRYETGFFIRLKDKTTLQEYNDYLSANPLTVFYELATPVELPTMSFE